MRLGECWWGAGVGCEGLLEQHQLSLAGGPGGVEAEQG